MCVTRFSVVFALLLWSGTKPTISGHAYILWKFYLPESQVGYA